MREMADRLMDHPGHAPDVILSKSAPQFDKIRPYKKGGAVKKPGCQKFALGGAAKIRLGVMTANGKPINKPKMPRKRGS
jgi:hypothetical protein